MDLEFRSRSGNQGQDFTLLTGGGDVWSGCAVLLDGHHYYAHPTYPGTRRGCPEIDGVNATVHSLAFVTEHPTSLPSVVHCLCVRLACISYRYEYSTGLAAARGSWHTAFPHPHTPHTFSAFSATVVIHQRYLSPIAERAVPGLPVHLRTPSATPPHARPHCTRYATFTKGMGQASLLK